MSKLITTLALLAAAAATALITSLPAAADNGPNQPRARSACAFVRSINNFKEIDDYTAILETGPSRRFLVRFVNNCRELKWAFSARVDARAGICLRPGDKIIVGRHGFREHCYIRSIEAIPRDQPIPASTY